jgi:energy-coupling factor transporter ATP-binding protein EcfA2
VSLLSARDLWVAPPAEGAQRQGDPDPVIRGFSLELGAGEWLALCGANGCGKTSLLLALAGLWPVRSGDLLFEGQPFGTGMPGERRAHLAVILQDPSSQLLQPTSREELAFSALNLGHPPDEVAREVARWSDRLGLADELERDPQQLSAGRQQLVLLAAALVSQPALLLADEPAAHFDDATRRRVLKLVRGEVDRGLSVVWVTQDADEAASADRSLALGLWSEDCVRRSATHWEFGTCIDPDRPEPHLVAARDLARSQTQSSEHNPRVTLLVSPWDGGGGPAVRTSVALEIPVAKTGVTAIEGPNAAGKSVLLAAAAGVLRLEQVQVVAGADLGSPPILCSQYPELEIFEEKARDEVVYAAVSRGVPRALAMEQAVRLLERLGPGSGGLLQRHTWGLSGGEKRLLALVATLIAPASLYVLDEPTAGLDSGRRLALAGILEELSRQAGVLLASQDWAWLDGLTARRHRLGWLAAFGGGPRQETD